MRFFVMDYWECNPLSLREVTQDEAVLLYAKAVYVNMYQTDQGLVSHAQRTEAASEYALVVLQLARKGLVLDLGGFKPPYLICLE